MAVPRGELQLNFRADSCKPGTASAVPRGGLTPFQLSLCFSEAVMFESVAGVTAGGTVAVR